jgi:hypothetical protein
LVCHLLGEELDEELVNYAIIVHCLLSKGVLFASTTAHKAEYRQLRGCMKAASVRSDRWKTFESNVGSIACQHVDMGSCA